MRTEGSTRAKCQGGRDVRNVYPAAPWKAPLSVRANGDAGALIPTPLEPVWRPGRALGRVGRGLRVHLVIVERREDGLYARLTSRPWREAVTVIWDRRLG